ncbi:MAG TPA: hypothetical protein VM598_03060 [Bdellovibrionota bacterium]|nr:hypothetical protein [Bdellovibrionota bacterium]
MCPIFRFMTGANMYRCEASSREEAIQFAIDSLSPNDDTRAVIESTMYEEGTEAVQMVEPEPEDEPEADAEPRAKAKPARKKSR